MIRLDGTFGAMWVDLADARQIRWVVGMGCNETYEMSTALRRWSKVGRISLRCADCYRSGSACSGTCQKELSPIGRKLTIPGTVYRYRRPPGQKRSRSEVLLTSGHRLIGAW